MRTHEKCPCNINVDERSGLLRIAAPSQCTTESHIPRHIHAATGVTADRANPLRILKRIIPLLRSHLLSDRNIPSTRKKNTQFVLFYEKFSARALIRDNVTIIKSTVCGREKEYSIFVDFEIQLYFQTPDVDYCKVNCAE